MKNRKNTVRNLITYDIKKGLQASSGLGFTSKDYSNIGEFELLLINFFQCQFGT